MQKRERLLAGAVALLVGGWLVDSVVIQPTAAWFAAMDKSTQAATREAGEATVLIDRQARILADWRSRHAAGLVDDEDQARFRLQRTLQDSAKSSGFTITSVGGGQLVGATQEQVYDLLIHEGYTWQAIEISRAGKCAEELRAQRATLRRVYKRPFVVNTKDSRPTIRVLSATTALHRIFNRIDRARIIGIRRGYQRG